LLFILEIIYKPWLKEKELNHLVRDILKFILFAEDVEINVITFRTRDVHLVDSLIRKLESITGLRKLDKEKVRVTVDKLMLKKLSEELKMV
jgi:hypothetical protein